MVSADFGSFPSRAPWSISEQVRLLFQDVVAKAIGGQTGSGAADRGVDLDEFRPGILRFEPLEALHAPAGLSRDAAADIADPELGSLLQFRERVRKSAAGTAVVRGGAQRQKRRQQYRFHLRLSAP